MASNKTEMLWDREDIRQKPTKKRVTNYALPENLLDIDIITTMYRKITKILLT